MEAHDPAPQTPRDQMKILSDDEVAILGIRAMLQEIGEDPDREGLRDTPARVVKALSEMTSGYAEDPKKILARSFEVLLEHYDEMIILSDISFISICEHHLLPFTGSASIGYIPSPEDRRVVGISKLARLVHCYSRRLQIQERLTHEISHAIESNLNAIGVGVVIQANHECMRCRGVRTSARMITSSMLGVLREKPEARAEFLKLIGDRRR